MFMFVFVHVSVLISAGMSQGHNYPRDMEVPSRALPPLPPLPGSGAPSSLRPHGPPSRPAPPMARHMRGSGANTSSPSLTSSSSTAVAPPIPARRHTSEKSLNGAASVMEANESPPPPVPKDFAEASIPRPRRQPPARPQDERPVPMDRAATPPVALRMQPIAGNPPVVVQSGRGKMLAGGTAPAPAQTSSFAARPTNTPPLPPTPEPSRKPRPLDSGGGGANKVNTYPRASQPAHVSSSAPSVPPGGSLTRINELESLVSTLRSENPMALEQPSREAIHKFYDTSITIIEVVRELSDANCLIGAGKVTLMKFRDQINTVRNFSDRTAKGVLCSPDDQRALASAVQKVLASVQKFLDGVQR